MSKKDRETMICALADAISDRESYLDCHMTSVLDKAKNKFVQQPMKGYGDIIRRTKSIIKRYRALADKLREQK